MTTFSGSSSSFSVHGEGLIRDKEEGQLQLNLPPGYRFVPSECELINYYLLSKILDHELSSNTIKEFDLYQYDPDQIPISELTTGKKNEAYSFTQTIGAKQRQTNNGYWEETREDADIVCSNQIVGCKKTVIFYKGKAPLRERTDWTIYEYRLHRNIIQINALGTEIERYVVCKICYGDLDSSDEEEGEIAESVSEESECEDEDEFQ